MKRILLGCIADDFTGATDLANNLVRAGMRVLQTVGVPTTSLNNSVDAVVISLKIRMITSQEAVTKALQALQWLQDQGASQIYFKYCSTFDSTPQGNIGPVIDALMAALKTDFTIATPAFPALGRTVFKGYLFVGDGLLHESGMQDHPLTPMTDSNLLRVLSPQTTHKVGLIDHTIVAQGTLAIREQIELLKQQGFGIAIVDVLSNDDLYRLAPALADLPLVTAGSGVAIGLPANFGITPNDRAALLPAAQGLKAVLAGSCSRATNLQVATWITTGRPAFMLDPMRMENDADAQAMMVRDALAWALPHLLDGPVLIYSTIPPKLLKQVQNRLGSAEVGKWLEQSFALIARELVAVGVAQLVVAGGEISGAVVQALGMQQLQIGEQIEPGVPWCAGHTTVNSQVLHISLKSGNFGSNDFLLNAFMKLTS